TRFAEADRGGFVPDDVFVSQEADQHDHEDRVDGAVHAAAEDGADDVAGAPGEGKADAHLAEVAGDVGDARARAAIGREEVELPAEEAGARRLWHVRLSADYAD